MTHRIYPMSPTLNLASFCGFPFNMSLVKRVERFGRELAFFFRLETT